MNKAYKLFHIVRGDILKIGDKITPEICGSVNYIEEGYDFIRLDQTMNVAKFVKDVNESMKHTGSNVINNVMYITNNHNIIVGIIPFNYYKRS